MTTPAEFRESFARQGVPAVRAFIEAGRSRPGVLDDGTLEAIRWLEEKEAQERADFSAKTDALSEEARSIAREANRIASEALAEARSNSASARRQARYAMYAAIVATTAAIVSAKEEIWSLIAKFL
jgi:hypothetical protein